MSLPFLEACVPRWYAFPVSVCHRENFSVLVIQAWTSIEASPMLHHLAAYHLHHWDQASPPPHGLHQRTAEWPRTSHISPCCQTSIRYTSQTMNILLLVFVVFITGLNLVGEKGHGMPIEWILIGRIKAYLPTLEPENEGHLGMEKTCGAHRDNNGRGLNTFNIEVAWRNIVK